ncbi:MAG: hypothetical protein ACREGB_02205, partial [Candidatus Saccharimonadales bacterium]
MSNENNEFLIGQSVFGPQGGNFTKHKYFYIKDANNYFRVLPPLFSLAQLGTWAKFYSVHRGLRATDGHQRPFLCNEVVNRKTKLIERHCALCDMARDLEQKLDLALKHGQCTKEQAKEARTAYLWPLQAEKRFYMNAVDAANQIGVLNIPYRSFKSLEARIKEVQTTKGFDPTGIKGSFFNFKKVQEFKGDSQTQYPVDEYLEMTTFNTVSGPVQAPMPKLHELTQDFIMRIKTEAADLTKLFKEVSDADVSTLASLQGPSRAEYLTKMFATPEVAKAADPNPLKTSIPGTTAQMVSQIGFGPSGPTITTPDVGSIKPTAAPQTSGFVQQAPAATVVV